MTRRSAAKAPVRVVLCVLVILLAAAGMPLRVPAQAPPGGSASVPRTADGKPDFSGIWQALNTAAFNIEDHSAELDVPAGQGVVEGGVLPYLPGALQKRNENFKTRATADPVRKCFQPGVPRIMYMPHPFQIVQTPTHMAFLFEYVHTTRHIHMTGEHPPGPIDWWLGDSRGRWDGDTLVVDVVHFNDQTWFDGAGNFHSEAMHLVERFSFRARNHIDYEVTVEDPKVFSRPWTMRMPLYRRVEPNFQILDYVCQSFQL
jgi:hypothetical protein